MPQEIHRVPRRRVAPPSAGDGTRGAGSPAAEANGPADPGGPPDAAPAAPPLASGASVTSAAAPPAPAPVAGAGPRAGEETVEVVSLTPRAGRRMDIGTEGERTVRAGRHAGDRSLRIVRPRLPGFRAIGGSFLSFQDEPPPTGAAGRFWRSFKRTFIGRPIATAQQGHERLTKVKALAVFSSDALSSVAYSTEAILFCLLAGGASALSLVLPIGIVIAVLLGIVSSSYRQTVYAYPKGGGSYIVAKDNLGTLPGLVAGAALLIDYVLTVAVSTSAGVAAITSAFPALHEYAVPFCLGCIALITLLNLRGVRESGTILAAPTYVFIAAMLGLIVTGLVRLTLGGVEPVPPDPEAAAALSSATQNIGLFFLLNAFAQGCSALTGVEAISDGVPAFQPPESKNDAHTLVWMASLLAVMVIGTSFLARALNVVPHEGETVLSMIGTAVFGRGALYQVLQWSTFLILVLAANTAYADFPRLSSIMARDKFLPGQFTFRGDRLAFTNGIVVLGILAAGLVVLYGGDEQALIPLYAVGVFLSFTLSQSGMVMRHWRLREPHWQGSIVVNGLGAATTAVVLAVIVASKFTHGAWMIVVLVPVLVGLFLLIENHYREAADQLVVTSDSPTTDPELDPRQIQHTILIPIGDVNRPALRAIAYARSLTGAVTHSTQEGDARIVAVHVTDDLEAAEQLKQRWQRSNAGVPLVIVESPYRSLVQPLLTYINALEGQGGSEGRLGVVTVLLPEFVPAHWWENLLHTQTALRLKGALLFRPHTVVTSVPYHLRDL